jgi:site-specific DNA-methyltransferase (adenine-specific)
MTWPEKNLLCFGDNLAFLKDFSDACVDLVYLDPPFNSQQSYNVLFKESSGAPETAQIKAFEDTWTWDFEANKALTEIQQSPEVPAPLVELTKTFMAFLKPSPMMAYLVQMAVRLVQMHRVLKPTGSLYLHCDPTASHYLKIILDAIFGPTNFLNEITWKRTHAHGSARRFGPLHDIILLYAKSDVYVWTDPRESHDPAYIDKHFNCIEADTGRRFQPISLTGAGVRHGESGKPWRGVDPTRVGRHWALPGEIIERLGIRQGAVQDKLDALDSAGKIYWPTKEGGTPRLKWYADELAGAAIPDMWTDIAPISAQASERLGYQTQKPLALLRRIISASSNPGDVVLDPFCGCGTTIDAVETLNREHSDRPPRRWIGIDITHLSINLIKHRLTRFTPPPEYEIQGEPASYAGAAALAAQDPYQFQFWALGLVGARPVGGAKKKGADRGIDGVRYFQDEQKGGAWLTKKMLVQVKSGHVKAGDIRDLAGTLQREGAELGVFLTFEPPSQPMRTEAAAAGSYVSPWDNQPYPKVQILTVESVLKDPHRPNPRCLQIPGGAGGPNITLPEAPKHKRKGHRQRDLEFGQEP